MEERRPRRAPNLPGPPHLSHPSPLSPATKVLTGFPKQHPQGTRSPQKFRRAEIQAKYPVLITPVARLRTLLNPGNQDLQNHEANLHPKGYCHNLGFLCPLKSNEKYGGRVWRKQKDGFSSQPAEGGTQQTSTSGTVSHLLGEWRDFVQPGSCGFRVNEEA